MAPERKKDELDKAKKTLLKFETQARLASFPVILRRNVCFSKRETAFPLRKI